MDEDEFADGDNDGLGALDPALDECNYPNGGDALPLGERYYDVDEPPPPPLGDGDAPPPIPPLDPDEAAAVMQYALPAGDVGSAPPMALGQSFGSTGGGMAEASMSSLPEDIDVTTHGLIDETVQRLSFIHGVFGVLIIDRDGMIVHATMPAEEAAQLTGPTLQMLQRARAAVAHTPGDELSMLCVRTRKYEMLLCSEANVAFAVCVLQDPQPDTAVEAATSGAARSMRVASAAPGVVF